MGHHKVKRNEFRLDSGAKVSIEYWVNTTKICVAAFDTDGHQISRAAYHADVENAADLSPELQESLIGSLANALEYELINHPELSIRTR
jgi:hypothetical protein